jgi:hypothetical protein
MPIDYTKYPKNWLTEIRPRILARDHHCCKKCDIQNYLIIQRYKGGWRKATVLELDTLHYKIKHGGHNMTTALKYLGLTKIVLTIAHLDQDITNNVDENLAALCQKCHLQHDSNYRKEQRSKQRLNNQLTLAL